MNKTNIFILIFSLKCLFIQGQQNFMTPAHLYHQDKFIITDQDSVFQLTHTFLINNTIHVKMDHQILKDMEDYRIDLIRGCIFLQTRPDSGHTLYCSYQRLPLQLKTQYSHWTVSDTILPREIRSVRAIRKTPLSTSGTMYGADLRKSGSIFRGISLGTDQGMRLQSGLRMQVSGNISSSVEVIASLTDQNTPIQPEGNTQTLQEIDKVFINIKAPHFQATMGDYMFEVKGGQLGSYMRKLQGAMGTASVGMGSITLAAAASKGEFTNNNFMGQEGNQGPYQLTGTKGQREIIILAGTERVWIDGESMTRGEDNDYTIEYGNGQIIFTRNRLITSDSRISIDFEYSDQKFQKNIYGVVGDVRFWNNRVQLKTSFLREADDKENPLDLPLTDEYRTVLESAGDQPDSSVYSGAAFMGENKGYYKKADSSGIIYYYYTGQEQGDYNVRFSYVGEGQGDYSFQGYGIYRYEGSNRGAYLPLVYLPLAISHQMATLTSHINLGSGILFEGEMGISDQDLNLYSSMDDEDNADAAYGGRFQMEKRRLAPFGKGMGQLGVQTSFRITGDQFRPVGRITEIEHGRKWGFEEGTSWGEKVYEFNTFYQPISAWVLNGEYGYFERQNGFKSTRKVLNTSFQETIWPNMHYQAEVIETEKTDHGEGYWLRHQGSIQGPWKLIQPSLSYEGEHRKDDFPDSLRTGFKFDEWTGKVLFKKSMIRAEWTESLRDDRQYMDGMLNRNSLAQTDRILFELQTRRGFTTSFMYTHRNRDYADPSSKDQKTDLADMKIQFSPGKRYLYGALNYRFSSTQLSQMVRDTLDVGEGLGAYRYDENLQELVPDPDGNLLIRSIQTGTFLPVNDIKASTELRIDFSRLWQKSRGFKKFLKAWSSRTLVRIERRDEERNFLKVNQSAIQPQWGEDTTTVTGLFSYHQDIEYTPLKKSLSLRFRYRKDDSENNQFTQESLLRHRRERSLRLKGSPFKRFGVLLEYLNQKDQKEYISAGHADRDITARTLTAEASFRPKQKIEFALKTKIKMAIDQYPDPVTKATSIFLIPRFGYSFLKKGNLRAEVELGDVRAEPEDRALPYEMLTGDQPGRTLRWTLLMTYKITGHVMATLTYRGRQEPWRKKLYQTGQMEVRAFF